MQNLRSLLTLGRPVTSSLIALAILAACIVGAGSSILQYYLQVLLGLILGFVFGLAGFSMNDYFDRDADKTNHPERPVPSGKISPRSALNYSLVMFLVSIVIALLLSTLAGLEVFVLVMVAFALQIGYEKRIKRVKFLGNMLIGVQTVLAFTLGGLIVRRISPTIVMAAAAFLSIVGREVVKDVEDIKGDVGKLTLPRIIGIRNANYVASLLIVSAIIVSIIGYYPLSIFGTSYLIVVSIADFLFLYSLPIIFQNPNKARRLLKLAMLIALLAFVIGGFSD